VFTSVAFLTLGPIAEAPLRLVDLRVQPDPPAPGQSVTVSVTTEGGSGFSPPTVWLFHAVSYRNEDSRVDRLTSESTGTYSVTIGPFLAGAELWIVAAAATVTQGPVFSEHRILPVGVVVKNATQFSIDRVFHIPSSPGPQGFVNVFADVGVSFNTTQVVLTHAWFSRGTAGALSESMWSPDGVSYQGAIETLRFGGVAAGTRFFYRVAASDASGLTADSGIQSFTVAGR
jgi:hypothetical protein